MKSLLNNIGNLNYKWNSYCLTYVNGMTSGGDRIGNYIPCMPTLWTLAYFESSTDCKCNLVEERKPDHPSPKRLETCPLVRRKIISRTRHCLDPKFLGSGNGAKHAKI